MRPLAERSPLQPLPDAEHGGRCVEERGAGEGEGSSGAEILHRPVDVVRKPLGEIGRGAESNLIYSPLPRLRGAGIGNTSHPDCTALREGLSSII